MELSSEHLDHLVDTFSEPGGVRLDPSIGLLVLSANELRHLAARLLLDADLLDGTEGPDFF